MSIAAYIRVSTHEQSTELQKRDIEAYSVKEGLALSWYSDEGVSGTTNQRPDLTRLMEDVRSGKVTTLIVWKMDRLFRSLKDLIDTLQELDKMGCVFISLKDNIDLSTPTGRLMMHLLGAFAEFEASLIRERVRAGLANAKAKGKKLGRPRTIEYTAIRKARQQGLTYDQIQTTLNVSRGAICRSLKAEK